MTEWELGYIDGERDAFMSRRAGEPLRSLVQPDSEYQRGYVAGYMPRRAGWWVRPAKIVAREEAQA